MLTFSKMQMDYYPKEIQMSALNGWGKIEVGYLKTDTKCPTDFFSGCLIKK